MVRVYRCILGGLIVLAIAFGVWYVMFSYNEQRSVENATLVSECQYGKEEGRCA